MKKPEGAKQATGAEQEAVGSWSFPPLLNTKESIFSTNEYSDNTRVNPSGS